jgi:hypothetical protein
MLAFISKATNYLHILPKINTKATLRAMKGDCFYYNLDYHRLIKLERKGTLEITCSR